MAALLVGATATAAAAVSATGEQVRELARDAAFDPDALRRLKAIDEIDGRPADLGHLLGGASGTEIERRIEVLLRSPAAAAEQTRDPGAARAEARAILRDDRYRPDEIPRPFRGPLEWIADRLEPVGNVIDAVFGWLGDVFGALASGTPGGAGTLWTIVGLAVVAAVWAQTQRVVERRGAARARRGDAGASQRRDDPRDLERRAAAARARGDHELAVRLLFRAGLLRLVRARAIPARDSLTTGEIRRLLRSPEFDQIGASFDEIAYGRRPATDADSTTARTAWPAVLSELGPRKGGSDV